jgi:hypothetical protein
MRVYGVHWVSWVVNQPEENRTTNGKGRGEKDKFNKKRRLVP